MARAKTHTVRYGDTLASISKAYYGSEDFDDYIFSHNTTVILNPNVLYPGQVIIIPHIPALSWL